MEKPLTKNQELADYIKRNLEKGYDLDSLKYSLLSQGYSRTSVKNAIELAEKQIITNLPKIEEPRVEVIDSDELKRKVELDEQNESFFTKIKRFFS